MLHHSHWSFGCSASNAAAATRVVKAAPVAEPAAYECALVGVILMQRLSRCTGFIRRTGSDHNLLLSRSEEEEEEEEEYEDVVEAEQPQQRKKTPGPNSTAFIRNLLRA